MRYWLPMLLILLPITALAKDGAPAPPPPFSPTAVEWRFAGFTETLTTGNVTYGTHLRGYPAMNAICAGEVSPHARVCTSVEVARSTRPDTATEGWILPTQIVSYPMETTWVSVDSATGASDFRESDVRNAPIHLNCNGYTTESDIVTGLVYKSYGVKVRIPLGDETTTCNESKPIACCAPVAVPPSSGNPD